MTGRWVHSHEEDTDDLLVYRRPDFGFPPARGRESIDLRADGSYTRRAPGPDDVPVETGGRWQLVGDRLELEDDVWQLAGEEPDRLTFRK